jgi:hypothetical protein
MDNELGSRFGSAVFSQRQRDKCIKKEQGFICLESIMVQITIKFLISNI